MNLKNIDISLKETLELLIAIIIGCSSLYSANVSHNVKKNMNKIFDKESYNSSRESIIKELEYCNFCLTDEDVKLNLTNVSKIQSAIHKLKQYPYIFSKKEKRSMDLILNSIEVEEYNSINRVKILREINGFIAKLNKGDIKT